MTELANIRAVTFGPTELYSFIENAYDLEVEGILIFKVSEKARPPFLAYDAISAFALSYETKLIKFTGTSCWSCRPDGQAHC